MAAWVGEVILGENGVTSICMTESFYCPHENITTHCQSAIFQYKIKSSILKNQTENKKGKITSQYNS